MAAPTALSADVRVLARADVVDHAPPAPFDALPPDVFRRIRCRSANGRCHDFWVVAPLAKIESEFVRTEAHYRQALGQLGGATDGTGVLSIGPQDPRAVGFLTGAFHQQDADWETRYQHVPPELLMPVAKVAWYLGVDEAKPEILRAFARALQEGTPVEARERFITVHESPIAEDFSVRAAVYCLTHFDEVFGYVAGDPGEEDNFSFDVDFDFSQLSADALATLLLTAGGMPASLVSPTKLWRLCEQWAQAGMDTDDSGAEFAARMGHVLFAFPFVHAPTVDPELTAFASRVAAHLQVDQAEALKACLALPVAKRQTALVWGAHAAPDARFECQARAVKEVLATLGPTAPGGFVYLPPGEFLMGSPADEEDSCSHDDEVQHQVRLSRGFFVAKHLVTQEDYATLMHHNPSHFHEDGPGNERAAARPVERVSWYDAIRYCNAKSLADGLTPCYDIPGATEGREVTCHPERGGYHLLTEAQWEYAARAGTPGDPYGPLDAIAWHLTNSDRRTHPVGTKAANAFGLYDTLGNVYEWVGDWFAEDLSRGESTDPAGGDIGLHRACRGGSFGAKYLIRASARFRRGPNDRDSELGFRLARSVLPGPLNPLISRPAVRALLGKTKPMAPCS